MAGVPEGVFPRFEFLVMLLVCTATCDGLDTSYGRSQFPESKDKLYTYKRSDLRKSYNSFNSWSKIILFGIQMNMYKFIYLNPNKSFNNSNFTIKELEKF